MEDEDSDEGGYIARQKYWMDNPPPFEMYCFDKRIHYPFGRPKAPSDPNDFVYRRVPVYSSSLGQKLMVSLGTSAASSAGSRASSVMADVGAGVPKRPIVRELFVDAVTDTPIVFDEGKRKDKNYFLFFDHIIY